MKLSRSTTLATAYIGIFIAYSASSTAQTATSASVAPAYELAYNIGAVSDYRYRGVSQSRLKPAVQGGIDLTAGTWYAGVWASNIKWVKDAGGKAQVELDVYGGYKYAINKDFTLDVGALSYVFPSNQLAVSANTTEVYVGIASGAYSAKYSHAVTNLFGFGDSKNSSYLEANADYELIKGTNLVAHIGRQTVKNTSTASYTDYKLGITHELQGAFGGKLSASVIGTNNKTYVSPTGKNLSKTGLVVGYTKTF